MSGIVVIANPTSRHNRKNPGLIPRLEAALGSHGTLYATSSLDMLAEVAQRIVERAPEVICFNGGDGTNHWGLSAVLTRWPKGEPLPVFAFLRGGTMNTVAGGLGITGEPESLLAGVLSGYAGGAPLPTRSVTPMLVQGERYGFLFGTGAQAKFLDAYYEGGDASPWKAVKVLSQAVGSTLVRGELYRSLSTPEALTVEADGEVWPFTTYDMIGAGTVPNIAFFFRPYHRAFEDPERFHTWGVACGITPVVARLWKVARALPPEHPKIVDRLVKQMTVRGEKILYQLDGEIFRAQGELTVQAARPIRVFAPGVNA